MPQDPQPDKPVYEPPDTERPASSAPTEHLLEYETPGVEAVDATPAKHDPYSALRIGGFRMFTFAWMAHVIGHQMQSVALGWEVYDRTGDALALGLIGGVQALPLIVLSLPAGVVADRFDRRRIILITSLLAACCSLGLAMLSYRFSVHWLFLMIMLENTMLVFGRPARSALLPQIVPPGVFANAVTWNSSFFQICSVAGPALSGFVIYYNLRSAYIITAIATLVFGITVSLIQPKYAVPRTRGEASAGALEQLTAGVRFVFRSRLLLAALTLDLFAVLLGGAVYLMPAFAMMMDVGKMGLGWLRAAEAVGAFSTAILLAHLPPMKRAGRAMLLAVMMFGLATVIFGLSKSFALSLAMLVIIGAMDMVSVVVRHTLVQTITPDSMRGRVSAVNQVFIGASNEIGGFESGLVARAFGPVVSVVSGGIGTMLVVLGVNVIFPQVRKLGSLKDLKPEPEPSNA